MLPSSYIVAVAIYAAAREVVSSEVRDDIALGCIDDRDASRRYLINRARSYAAVALLEAFPKASKKYIALAVGITRNNPTIWICNLELSLKREPPRYWDDAACRRVKSAVAWAMRREWSLEPPIDVPAFITTPPRPAASERQVMALRLLQEAVANTAALQARNEA